MKHLEGSGRPVHTAAFYISDGKEQTRESKRVLLDISKGSYDILASLPRWDPMKIILLVSAYESSSKKTANVRTA
jgi:hypothetical protein